MRYEPGVASDYSYFAPAGNFPSFFELFETCLVFRQRKTATGSIESSKGRKVLYAKRGNQTQAKHLKDEMSPKKASFFFARTEKHAQKLFRLLWRNRTILFSPATKKGPAIFFSCTSIKGAAQEKRGAVSRTMPSVRGEKTGFTTNRCASATFHHLFYALLRSRVLRGVYVITKATYDIGRRFHDSPYLVFVACIIPDRVFLLDATLQATESY